MSSSPRRIAVTGATGQVGSLLVPRLEQAGWQVRAVGRGADLLRELDGAEAAVHLAGALKPRRGETYRQANYDTAAATVAAAERSGVRRLLFVSYVGARPDAPNEYLRWKGRAEQLFEASPLSSLILRVPHLVGPPSHPGPTAAALLRRGRAPVAIPGGDQRLAPLLVADLVEILLRALEAPAHLAARVGVGGPDVMTLEALVRLLNGGAARILRLPEPAARFAARMGGLSTLVDVMLADSVPTSTDGAAESLFGHRPRSLTTQWLPRSEVAA